MLGTRALIEKHGAAVVNDACVALLELGLADYRSLRRYLDRRPTAPLSLAQVDPLIRSRTAGASSTREQEARQEPH